MNFKKGLSLLIFFIYLFFVNSNTAFAQLDFELSEQTKKELANVPYCVYDAEGLYSSKIDQSVHQFMITYLAVEKSIMAYSLSAGTDTWDFNYSLDANEGYSAMLRIAPEDIYDSATGLPTCKNIKMYMIGEEYYICSESLCDDIEPGSIMTEQPQFKYADVKGGALTTNTTNDNANVCNETQIKNLKSLITDSSELEVLRSSFNNLKAQINAFDFKISFDKYKSQGMTDYDASIAVMAEYERLGNTELEGASEYKKLVEKVLANKVHDELNCSYDFLDSEPTWYELYYNQVERYEKDASAIAYSVFDTKVQTSGLPQSVIDDILDDSKEARNTMTDEINEIMEDRITTSYDKMREIGMGGSVDATCDAMLTDEAVEFLNKILDYFKIAAPILVIVLGILDFAQATLSSDKEILSKSVNKFIKRCIAAILLFFIPTILNLLLSSLKNLDDPLCGVGTIIFNYLKL